VPKKTKHAFTQRLLALISEREFIEFENILREPNIFKIVRRTHYERWHSCFWGWLLDANGSHLLFYYPLIRLLSLLLDERCPKPSSHPGAHFFKLLPTLEFSAEEVTPNENSWAERSIRGVGRLDIFLKAAFTDALNNTGNLNVILELKIDSKPDPEQSRKYADWLLNSHPDDVNFLIYLTPHLRGTAAETVGDDRWYCLDYQLLNDKLLLPLLAHPNLNDKAKPLIAQYVKNLRIRHRGIKMAITDEEKRMAVALYEKYSDVFESIYDALLASGAIDYSISDSVAGKGRVSGRVAAKIDGKVFSNDTLRLLFADVLKFLVDKKHVLKLPLPWGTSNQRYIITNEAHPTHPSGREFFYPVKYRGYTLESHYSRDRGMKVLSDLCAQLGLAFEAIET